MSTDPRATQNGWRLLRHTLRQQRRGLTVGVSIGLLWTIGKIAVPQLTRFAIDEAIVKSGSLLTWTLLILSAAIIAGLFSGMRRYFAFRESRMTETLMREKLFAHIQGLDVAYHDRAQTGQLMSRASTDLQLVQGFVVMLPLVMANVAQIIGVVIILLLGDPLLALVALLPLPFLNIIAQRFSKKIHPANLVVQQEQAQLATVVEESIAGVRVVKGFGAEAVMSERLRAEADDIQRAALAAARIRSTFLPGIDLLPALGLVAVLGIGGHRVLNGDMTIGELVAFNTYVTLLIWPLRNIAMTIALGQRAATALVRIDEVLAEQPQISDPLQPSHLPLSQPGRSVGAVHFDNVTFSYLTEEGMVRVLEHLSLHIRPGESVAIVGATGSGKSTLARLLLRFYDPEAGSIRLDDVDVRQLPLRELRSNVGVVFEDTLLFNDTVSANIAFARPHVDSSVVRRAAQLAGAHDFIAELPEGYDTILGERGYSLSGGQRQRIAIARAIVADPRVLVLDDATSAVDPTKEHEIRDALVTVMKGRTTIVIAHRPATIELADRVALLDEGTIVATGTHRELLDTNERYREVLAAWSAPEVGDGAVV